VLAIFKELAISSTSAAYASTYMAVILYIYMFKCNINLFELDVDVIFCVHKSVF